MGVTVPDFIWLDAFPRRFLMNVGLAAVPLPLPHIAAMALLTSAAAYQFSVGPLSWIMPTEVLPNELRTKGSAITSTMYAAAGMMLIQLHPVLARSGPILPLATYASCT